MWIKGSTPRVSKRELDGLTDNGVAKRLKRIQDTHSMPSTDLTPPDPEAIAEAHARFNGPLDTTDAGMDKFAVATRCLVSTHLRKSTTKDASGDLPIAIKDFTLAPWEGYYYLGEVIHIQLCENNSIAVTVSFVDRETRSPLVSIFTLQMLRLPYRLSKVPTESESMPESNPESKLESISKLTSHDAITTCKTQSSPITPPGSVACVRSTPNGGFEAGYVSDDSVPQQSRERRRVYLKESGDAV